MDRLRIHDLRHTAVALWMAAGANPKEVAARAGHASVSFTLDRYGHLYPEPIRRSGTAWTPCMPSPSPASSQGLTDQRRTRRATHGWKARPINRRVRPDLAVWLVGVTGLEPVTSSL